MRNFSITDSHIHLIDSEQLSYPWLEEASGLNPAYVLADMVYATKLCNVDSLVVVQAECLPEQAPEEINWITVLAQRDTRINGIVARVPIEKGLLVFSELEALKQNPLVKGVRRLIDSESDPFFCVKDEFIAGVQMLADFDYSFDLCVRYHQIPQAIHLVQQCPKVNFVLDHLGKPNIAENIAQPWEEYLVELAKLPNVYCKISGLVTEADPFTWEISHLAPYVHYAIKVFGFDRVMFGSDWPVLDMVADYKSWLDTVIELTKSYPEDDLEKFFSKNASKFYRLETAK